MKRKRKTSKAVFTSLLSLLLVISTMANTAGARGVEGVDVHLKSMGSQYEVKVEKNVYDAFRNDEVVELIVEMKEQVDTSAVALQAREQMKAIQHVSPFQQNLQTRYAVVDTLKSSAEISQKPLLQTLESSEYVKEVKSFYIMNVMYVKAKKAVLEELKRHPEVANVRLDSKIEVDWPESSSSLTGEDSSQSLDGSAIQEGDSNIEWNIDHVGAPRVWNEFGIDGSGVVVGLIDTGAHWSHEALKEKWRGYNPLDPNNPNPVGNWFDAVSNQSMPYDLASVPHGSHVLGTILGQDPAGNNKIGVAPGAKWIAARAFTEQGGQDSWLLAAGEFMLAPNGDPSLAPDIVNNSWGGGAGLNEWFRPMVQAWRDAGILPVFSAGNAYPNKVSAPANYPESYAVAATDSQNRRGGFSSVGPGPYEDDLKPDISAPGVNIRSSVPTGYEGGWNGTSMAAPHISGVAALLRSVDVSLTVDEIEEIINETAEPLTDSQYSSSPNYGYGNGLVNAYEAVASIATGIGGITGQVLKNGMDEEGPVISHEPFQFSYTGLDVVLDTQVTDNISVVRVDLYVRQDEEDDWEIVEQKRNSGDFMNGNYQVEIPLEYVKDPGFQYMMKAVDFSGNEAETQLFNVEVSFGIDPGDSFDFNFDEYLEGLLLSGDWEWGAPTSGTTPREGENLVATKLDGNYSDTSDSILQFPPIDVRNVENLTVSFQHWFDIEYMYDQAKVVVTDDIQSGEWYEVDSFTGRERTWEDLAINLDQYAGSDNQVFVALLFTSDEKINHAGWYIDGLSISSDPELEGVEVSETNVSIEKPVFHSVHKQKSPSITDVQNGLPLEAFVTVVETGRTVKTSLEDGSYHILHRPTPEGEKYTLRVETYGYYAQQDEFELRDEEVIEKNFLLAEIPRGQIVLNVVDKKTQDPIQGVKVKVVEDGRIPSAETDETGDYTFENVLEGSYTLSISIPNYHHQKVKVDVIGEKTSDVVVELAPFPGKAVYYDDGTAENAKAYYESGYGYATKMTPDKQAKLAGVSVYLWEKNWPVPGGDQFAVAVHESNEEGNPGKRVFAPKTVEGTRGEWNFVDLSEFDFETDKDYFVVVIQTGSFPNVPGLGIDESSPSADRSYQMDKNGAFSKLSSSYGNFMIRSHLYQVINAPVLNDASETKFVNGNIYSITGTSDEKGTINIYNGDNLVATTETANHKFAIEVDLNEGVNTFDATLSNGEAESSPSEPLKVVKDIIKPTISIESPASGITTNNQVITVTGTVTEENLHSFTLNDEEISITDNGDFNHELSLSEGINEIVLTASDLAGNEETMRLNVFLDTNSPVISNANPAEDLDKQPGETVRVSITSDSSGGNARLVIKDENGTTVEELDMEEVEPYVYAADWTIPEGASFSRVSLQVEHADAAGNTIDFDVPGKINLLRERMDRIYGADKFETAISISKEGWETSEVVVLARGDNFADALTGVPLAHKLDAPILLTRTQTLPNSVMNEIKRLGSKKVVVLGGSKAISDNVVSALRKEGVEVERIAGANLFDTASLIAKKVAPNGSDKAFVVYGRNFPDAISVASHAAREGIPVLLTDTHTLPDSTRGAIDELGVTESVIVGGTAVVSDAVMRELPGSMRVSGKDKYATNIEVAKAFGVDNKHMYIATGRSFADALTGAALASKKGSGILLVDKEGIRNVTREYFMDSTISRLTIFGGESAISNNVYEELNSLLK
ncbi:cell wall-binding repeat-containing protein [Sutcliffiella horikoshii]|uniref:S8 family serine peptidase n=1 Tax=Sutcliffiella horikoshii TaxID=79883 RepID=A0A5D4TA72_9BACI|nr:cell wall-binding repeat-containing protein [Sutcliffiella horikoshii]TYS72095.1 S8 family serine peptidase [Sutcliffiella horikoshii]